jgi:hypothetical protein
MVYGLYVISSVHRAFWPPCATTRKRAAQGISVGMPGPHDFAVRANGIRLPPPSRPSHPALNVRDDAYVPLDEHRTRSEGTNFGKKEIEIFLRGGLDMGHVFEREDGISFSGRGVLCR